MMEKMKSFFEKRNILYKLISLILAILIWFAVTKPFL